MIPVILAGDIRQRHRANRCKAGSWDGCTVPEIPSFIPLCLNCAGGQKGCTMFHHYNTFISPFPFFYIFGHLHEESFPPIYFSMQSYRADPTPRIATLIEYNFNDSFPQITDLGISLKFYTIFLDNGSLPLYIMPRKI